MQVTWPPIIRPGTLARHAQASVRVSASRGPGTIRTGAGSGLSDVFHSTAFEVTRNLALFFVVVFWLGLAYWVYRDARRRLDHPWLPGASVGSAPLRLVAP